MDSSSVSGHDVVMPSLNLQTNILSLNVEGIYIQETIDIVTKCQWDGERNQLQLGSKRPICQQRSCKTQTTK